MEEIALAVSRGLVGLIIPISLAATALALALIAKSVRQLRRATSPDPAMSGLSTTSSAVERIAVGICAAIALVGVVAFATNAILGDRTGTLHFLAVLGLWLLLSAPALMWRSRWRVPAEGLATIVLSVVAVLSGFSIGFVFVPLLLLMIWVCVSHLRADTKQPLSNHLASG